LTRTLRDLKERCFQRLKVPQTLEDCPERIPKDQNDCHQRRNVGFLDAVAQQISKTRMAAMGRSWRRSLCRNCEEHRPTNGQFGLEEDVNCNEHQGRQSGHSANSLRLRQPQLLKADKILT